MLKRHWFMQPRVEKLLMDVSLACEETSGFCQGKTYLDFTTDRMLQLVVEREGLFGK